MGESWKVRNRLGLALSGFAYEPIPLERDIEIGVSIHSDRDEFDRGRAAFIVRRAKGIEGEALRGLGVDSEEIPAR